MIQIAAIPETSKYWTEEEFENTLESLLGSDVFLQKIREVSCRNKFN